jgi:hypothetical protein
VLPIPITRRYSHGGVNITCDVNDIALPDTRKPICIFIHDVREVKLNKRRAASDEMLLSS